jgi:hypothetical protein
VIACGGPVPGEEFVETGVRPEIDETGENVGKVRVRIDPAELAGLDHGRRLLPGTCCLTWGVGAVWLRGEARRSGLGPRNAYGGPWCVRSSLGGSR